METLKKGSRGEQVKILQRHLDLLDDGIFGVLTEEAVKEFQKSHGLVADGIVGAKTWNALLEESGGDLMKSRRVITEIIVHCTDTPEGREVSVSDIRSWHKARGWSDIGYHYVVYLDGSVHEGRSVHLAGAHCSGHNTHSVGVVYVGGRGRSQSNGLLGELRDTRTDAQKAGLLTLLRQLKVLYPRAKVYGHRDFDKGRACPCFDAKEEYQNL